MISVTAASGAFFIPNTIEENNQSVSNADVHIRFFFLRISPPLSSVNENPGMSIRDLHNIDGNNFKRPPSAFRLVSL